jgi:uncharacterized membrane protein
MPEKRPKIKLPKTKVEWLWDVIGYSIYIGSLIFLIYYWSVLPAEVPAHYNALGEVDRWGSKLELLILPIVGASLALFMQGVERFPEKHNYPDRLNEVNAEKFYLQSRKMINSSKNICLLIFSLVLYESVSIALGWWNGFGAWFLPVMLLAVFIPIIVGIVKQQKIQ